MSKHTPADERVTVHFDDGSMASIPQRAARLLEAAPQMLEALEAIYKEAEELAEKVAIRCNMGVGEWEAFMPRWKERVETAIKAAKGETR